MLDSAKKEGFPTPQLLGDLAHAFYWFDDGLQRHMESAAGFSLHRTQSMIMLSISDGLCRQSDIARHLRVTRQAVCQGVRELEAKGLVRVLPDPANGRQKIVQFSARGETMRNAAKEGLKALEAVLTSRIGVRDITALFRVLECDWGDVPTVEELKKVL